MSETMSETKTEKFDPDVARRRFHETFRIYDHYVRGMPEIGRLMLAGTIQGGICHVLVEGDPGSAKTRIVEVIAILIGGRCHIIQGTPDLQPKEIVGAPWLDKGEGKETKWRAGWSGLPDATVVMGDEINRMSTLAQAALFGPMSEGRCTMQSPQLTPEETVKYMPAVRIFLCTQNDVGSEGTNILPPAQLDRFLHRIKPGRISREAEKELLLNPRLVDHGILEEVKAKRVLTIDEILATRKWVQENIHVSEAFIDFQLSVIRATVPGTPEFRDLWQNHLKIRPILDQIKSGVSVRGDLNLQRACQVEAFLHGTKEDRQTPRKIVLPVDLKRLAHSVMDHRIVMQERATHRRTNGTSIQNPFSNQYPADGSITRAQVIHRLENTGQILPEHVVDAILTHIDPTDDPAAYARA